MGLIRILLAFAVLCSHFGKGNHLLNPALAVETFFIISGFYMAMVLNEKYLPTPEHGKVATYRLFWGSRILRLFPAYLTVLAASILMQGLDFPNVSSALTVAFASWHGQTHLAPLDAIMVGASNTFLIGQDWLLFAGVNTSGHLYFTSNFATAHLPAYKFLFVPQAWSLGTEVAFYLVAPFIVTRRPVIVAAISAASLCLKMALFAHGLTNNPWTYRFFPSELGYFLIGSLAYRAYVWIDQNYFFRPKFALAAFGLIIFMLLTFGKLPVVVESFIFMPIFALSLPFIFKLTKNWKIDRLIGEHSYPFYISQFLAASVTYRLGHMSFIPVLVVTTLISVVLYWAIDRNVDSFRHRIVDRFEKRSRKATNEPAKEVALTR